MRVIYYLKNKISGIHVLTITFLTLTSCGMYQQATYDDGIYSSDQERIQTTETVNTGNDPYQNYFEQKSLEAEDRYGAIFTDVDSYSSQDYADPEVNVDAIGYTESYAAWGQEIDDITVNVYAGTGLGFSPFGVGLWNRGFRGNLWGWNGGWGFGWNNWGWNNWGWNNAWGFGWNNWGWNGGLLGPYGYYGYGGFYSPYFRHGYNGYAYNTGRRNYANRAYSRRSNYYSRTANQNNSRYSNSRSSRRTNNTIRSTRNTRNSNVRTTRNTRSSGQIRSSNRTSRGSVNRTRSSSSSRGSSVRSSGGSSRSSGTSSRGGSSRRGGR